MNIHGFVTALRDPLREQKHARDEFDWNTIAANLDIESGAADFFEYLEHQLANIDSELASHAGQNADGQRAEKPGPKSAHWLRPQTVKRLFKKSLTGADQLLLAMEIFLAKAAGGGNSNYFVALGAPRAIEPQIRAALLGADDKRLLLDDTAARTAIESLMRDDAGNRLPPAILDASEKPPWRLAQVAAWSVHIDWLGVSIKRLREFIELLQQHDASILVFGGLHNMAPILLQLQKSDRCNYSVATSHQGRVVLAIR